MKRLTKISWEIRDGNIVLKKRDSAEDDEYAVFLWDGNVRKDITLKALAKKVIEEDVTVTVTKAEMMGDGKEAFQLGPVGSVYHTLVRQGMIKETRPYVVE